MPRLARGEVICATSGRLDPGGKGVNGARALLADGVGAPAVLPAGGEVGRQLVGMRGRCLRSSGGSASVPASSPTRWCAWSAARLGSAADLAGTVEDVEGVGLIRTELLFLDRADAPTPAEVEGSDLWVMAPMVATPDEAGWFAERARAAGLSRLGVIVEVPAAALRADEILAEVDFLGGHGCHLAVDVGPGRTAGGSRPGCRHAARVRGAGPARGRGRVCRGRPPPGG